MKIKRLYLVFWLLMLAGCTINRELVTPQTTSTFSPTIPKSADPNKPIIGEWTQAKGGAGGFTNYDTFKNFQYSFDVAGNNQPVSIQLTSADINVKYALFDPLGQQIDVEGESRSVGQTYTLNAGTYRVVVMADRQAVGKFSLTVIGTKTGATLITSQILQSGTQSWGLSGSGGIGFTYKNPFFSFDVTDDNTSIDVELESADNDVFLDIFNPLGQLLTGSNPGQSRYRYTILKLNRGTYSVMASTLIRGSIGNFRLRITGKVMNLTKVESQSVSVQGTWANGNSFDTYSLDITANTSPLALDISLASTDTVCQIDIQDSAGRTIVYTVLAYLNNFLLGKDLTKATYLIKVYPGKVSGKAGNYTLDVFGKFTNFKKI